MSESKTPWTEGPLEVVASGTFSNNGGYHTYLADKTGRKIAALWGKEDEKLANGQLFAVGPEMAEALGRCLFFLEQDDLRRGNEADLTRTVRAILAKIEGDA